MINTVRVAALLSVMGASLPLFAADYYFAETGRSARTEVNTTEAMALVEPQGVWHTPGDGADLGSANAPIMEMSLQQLYSEDVENAILASGIDKVAVQNEGVETSLRTFAEIQINAITGKTRFEKMDPVYLMLGMVYQNMSWARAKIIPVENAELARAFGLNPGEHNRVSSVWVMKTDKVRMLVMSQLSGMDIPASVELSSAGQKALKKFAYRVGTFLNLPGELKLVPMKGQPDIWLSPLYMERPDLLTNSSQDLAREVARADKNAEPYKSMMALNEVIKNTYNTQADAGLAAATTAFLTKAEAADGYTPALKRKLDFLQTDVHPFKRSAQLFMLAFFGFLVYLLLLRKHRRNTPDAGGDGNGLVDGRQEEYGTINREPAAEPMARGVFESPALAMAGAGPEGSAALPGFGSGPRIESDGTFDNTGAANYGDPISTAVLEIPRGSRVAWGLAFFLMLGATIMLILALANRAYLGGRMPVSNMYESITFAMGGFAVLTLIFEGVYRRGWIGIGACFAGWTLMTMANSMSIQQRKIEPLVAVLNSLWLNYHVTSLLISYSCFLLAFVTGVLFLIKEMTGNRPGMLPRAETFEYLTYRSVQIGWPLLTLGIFLGAVWANTAWGSFWSWDPKETWALITWLTYTVYLHLRINLGWNGRKSVIASMVGFIMVLITYFGVSYLPGLAGGMHSYAEPIKR